jgi:hypothetical protein
VVPYWLEREVKEEEEDNADYNPIWYLIIIVTVKIKYFNNTMILVVRILWILICYTRRSVHVLIPYLSMTDNCNPLPLTTWNGKLEVLQTE